MDDRIGRDARLKALLAAALEGRLTDPQAEELAALDAALVKLVLLAAAQRIAELQGGPQVDPATPSGQRPVYTKPPAPKRRRKPGAKEGHEPARRPKPQRVDRHQQHRLDVCPDCGGDLQRCNRKRTRTVEDILEDLKTVVTEHTLHRDYCPACKKHVEPVVADALPKAVICLISALAFHEITTQIPHQVDLAVEQKAKRPPLAYPPIRVFWFSGRVFSEGVETHVLDGVPVRIYSPAKTVADCFKYRNKIGLDVALEGLRLCRQKGHVTVDELMDCARICRVADVMRPYLEAIL